MAFITEPAASEIEAYRIGLNKILDGKSTQKLLHEDIIQKLDESAKLFNALIVKTNLDIPYTSVFFHQKCGYWNAGTEQKLRNDLTAA